MRIPSGIYPRISSPVWNARRQQSSISNLCDQLVSVSSILALASRDQALRWVGRLRGGTHTKEQLKKKKKRLPVRIEF